MTRSLIPLLLITAPALAQVPYSYPSPYGPIPSAQSFAPNYFNRNYQPLSPYLNLGNSVNPAASYYYGVRPGTQGPTGLGPTFGSGAQMPPAVGRSLFLPPAAAATTVRDPNLFDSPQAPLPSPGGPVAYGNLNGSSRVGVGGPRSGFFGSGGSGVGGSSGSSGSGSGGSTIPPPRTPGNIPKVK